MSLSMLFVQGVYLDQSTIFEALDELLTDQHGVRESTSVPTPAEPELLGAQVRAHASGVDTRTPHSTCTCGAPADAGSASPGLCRGCADEAFDAEVQNLWAVSSPRYQSFDSPSWHGLAEPVLVGAPA